MDVNASIGGVIFVPLVTRVSFILVSVLVRHEPVSLKATEAVTNSSCH